MSVFEMLSKALGKESTPTLFSIEEKQDYYPFSSLWTIYKGKRKEDGIPITGFVFNREKYSSLSHLARNYVKRIKTIKHPNIIKVYDVHESDSLIAFSTEPVTPLSFIHSKQSQDPQVISWGLYTIAVCLNFLNTNCKMVHGNIRMDSIFITSSGEWKLGGFELVCGLDSELLMFLSNQYDQLPDSLRYIPPEANQSNFTQNPCIVFYDSWQYAVLVYELFNRRFETQSNFSSRGQIPIDFYKYVYKLSSIDPSKRLSLTTIISEPITYFQNPHVEMNLFIQNINMKTPIEKDLFLKNLVINISSIPLSFSKYKLLPELSKSLEFNITSSKAIEPILIISKHFNPQEYDLLVTPLIIKLFASTDRSIRVALCESMTQLTENFSQKTITDKIFPNLALGFIDTNALVRESTLKSILPIMPKLGEKVINNDLLRFMAKLQSDEEPGIRTNTTICLGKLGKYLNENTRGRVLVPAFSRSLQDPFPASRNAGLLAIMATKEYYNSNDLALKLIPCISSVCLDPDASIRTQALIALDVCLNRLKQLITIMNENQNDLKKIEQVKHGGDSWAGWAVSAISSGLSGQLSGATVKDVKSSKETLNNNDVKNEEINVDLYQSKQESIIVSSTLIPTRKESTNKSYDQSKQSNRSSFESKQSISMNPPSFSQTPLKPSVPMTLISAPKIQGWDSWDDDIKDTTNEKPSTIKAFPIQTKPNTHSQPKKTSPNRMKPIKNQEIESKQQLKVGIKQDIVIPNGWGEEWDDDDVLTKSNNSIVKDDKHDGKQGWDNWDQGEW